MTRPRPSAPAVRDRWMVAAIIAVCSTEALRTLAFTSFDLASPEGSAGSLAWTVPLAAAALLIQLRISLAFASGTTPRGARWSLVALAGVIYLPWSWFLEAWYILQSFLMASALMVLPRKAGAAVAAAPVVLTAAVAILQLRPVAARPVVSVYLVFTTSFGLTVATAAIYGVARLTRAARELRASRDAVAELAVAQERLHLAQDLHDVLGQSLSAISLKGDLATRLLERAPAAAQAEIRSLTLAAQQTLQEARAVAQRRHTPTWEAELSRAVDLLADAGVSCRSRIDLPPLSRQVDQVLAWTVREGVTNVLRHSSATWCAITAVRRADRIQLEIRNDGASQRSDHADPGQGLAGLHRRAAALGGSAIGTAAAGTFRLLVDLPERLT